MNMTLFLYFLFSSASTFAIDYSGFDVGLKQKSSKLDCMMKPILEVLPNEFRISEVLNHNTIVNPLEMWEIKMWEINRNTLEPGSAGGDKFCISGFETEIDTSSINSLFFYTLLKNYTINNLVVAVRDYYSEEEMKSIGKMFSVIPKSTVHIIPASLGFIVDHKLSSVTSEDCSLVVSTVGNKIVFKVYKTSKDNDKFTISEIHREVHDDISDNKLRKIILSNIREQILEHSKLNEKTNIEFSTYPILDTESEVRANFLNLLEVYEKIKNSFLSEHLNFTIREIFINGPTTKVPLLDIVIDVKKIVNEVKELLRSLEGKYGQIIQDLKEKMVHDGNLINCEYYISEFSVIFKPLFDLKKAVQVQNGFIKSGCIVFDKKNIELKDIYVFERSCHNENERNGILREIEIKEKAKSICEDVKSKGGLDVVLSNLDSKKYADLKVLLDQAETINLATGEKIVRDYEHLSKENLKMKKGKEARTSMKNYFEKVLNKSLALEKSEPELWSSGLSARVLSIKKWFDDSKDDENVLGDKFESKGNMLEGFVEAYRKKLVEKKKLEEKKRLEEEEKKVDNEAKKDDVEKQSEHVAEKQSEHDVEKQLEDVAEKQSEDVAEKQSEEPFKDIEEVPDMDNFDFEEFKSRYNDFLKNEKSKEFLGKMPTFENTKDDNGSNKNKTREL